MTRGEAELECNWRTNVLKNVPNISRKKLSRNPISSFVFIVQHYFFAIMHVELSRSRKKVNSSRTARAILINSGITTNAITRTPRHTFTNFGSRSTSREFPFHPAISEGDP